MIQDFEFNLDSFMAKANLQYGTDLKKKPASEQVCGTWNSFYSVETGGTKSFQHLCHDFRNCPTCMEDRKRQKYLRLKETMEHTGTDCAYSISLEPDDAKSYRKIRSMYGSDSVVRFPTDEETVLFLFVNEHDLPDFPVITRVTPEQLKEQDEYFTYLCNTPERKAISGGYVKPQIEETGEFVEVNRVVFHVGDKKLLIQLSKMAFDATSYLNPTPSTLQQAINERQKAFENAAKQLGVQIWLLSENQTVKVNVNKINWLRYELLE